MTQRDKLVDKFRARPSTARFSDVRKLLEMHGWEMVRKKGSHFIFRKPGERSLPVPVHNDRVDDVYIEQICDLLGLDE